MDSSDYAIQLATFSGVEQQVKTNDLLASLGQQMGLMGLSQLAGWVGMEARVAAPAFFDGSPITVFAEPPATADTSILVVRNESGQEVFRSPIDPAGGAIQWDGAGIDGLPVPAGLYRLMSKVTLTKASSARMQRKFTPASRKRNLTAVK